MPESLEEPPTRTVRRLLYNHWTPGNTAGYDPTEDPTTTDLGLPIHYGNYNSDLPDPQISLTQPQGENTVGGRWTGKNMQADEMNQHRRGFVVVQCWAEDGSQYNDHSAESVVHVLRQEVERVIGAFDEGPPDGEPNDDIFALSPEWNGRFANPEQDDPTPTWQSQVTVTYDWERSQ